MAFRESLVLDQLGLQGGSSLSWHMVPELRVILVNFSTDIVKMIDKMVENESWNSIETAVKYVMYPGQSKNSFDNKSPDNTSTSTHNPTNVFLKASKAAPAPKPVIEEEDDNVYVAECYAKVVSMLSYYIAEVWSFLKIEFAKGDQDGGNTVSIVKSHRDKKQLPARRAALRRQSTTDTHKLRMEQSYGRESLCELEPDAVACFLRIVIRFIKALLSVNRDGLKSTQYTTYSATLLEIKDSLLPSAEKVVNECFFSDGSTLTSNPPSQVFQTLRSKLDLVIDQ